MAEPTDITPAPTKPPTSACVVETGKPILVANKTVSAPPTATDKIKGNPLIISSGTSPFPEKFFNNADTKNKAVIDPKKVAILVNTIACLYDKTLLLHKVATPLKLSFAPLEYANKKTAIINRSTMLKIIANT